ncbi:MAG: serine hydrolase [Phycisphaeraceae bacterium]|nr:serine hydrolase [Phycisphaeraceae bacterium]
MPPQTQPPTDSPWPYDDPANHQLDSQGLQALWAHLAQAGTQALFILRHDRVVLDWSAPGTPGHRDDKSDRMLPLLHGTASAAKALVGGMSLLIALADRRLAIDDPASKWIPAWRDDPIKSKITIRQLATHTSGLQDAHQDGVEHADLPGWMGAFWRREPDPFSLARDRAPVIFEPGTQRHYSNPGMAMLAYVVTASLQGERGYPNIGQALAERVMRPLGVSDEEWSIGYKTIYELDGLQLQANWGGGVYSARAMAAVGVLMLHLGQWQGQSLFEGELIKQMAWPAEPKAIAKSREPFEPVSGLGWWSNADGAWPVLPRNTFCAAGAGHQLLLVVPEMDLVVVRQGKGLGSAMRGEQFWEAAYRKIFEPLARCFLPPVPPSPVIRTMQWADKKTIVRQAHDSDIWPTTWADDDCLYAAYGDGQGFFDPPVPGKLSMGIARVEGVPPAVKGVNVRAPSAEFTGHGPKGPKPCGMLMIEGVLYMLVRNDDRAGCATRLAWSNDHGATWAWADWRFDELGAPTFVNYGKNHAGARDEYVYILGHDGPSAYREADHYVLLRVAKDKLRFREAYACCAGLDQNRQPKWSADFSQRQPVLTHHGRCRRTGLTYNAGLKRFLLWAQISRSAWQSDTRFAAGFAVFDAPQPWGPWTAAYFTEQWDVGPGDTGHFPTKWMSPDGREMWLVFSGDDYFSLRQARIVMRE